MKAFLQMLIEKFTSGDVTLVEAVRWVNEWSGKVLAVIDGVPMPMGDDEPGDPGEVYSLYCQAYEMVYAEPPAMSATEAAGMDPMSILLMIMKLVEILKARQ